MAQDSRPWEGLTVGDAGPYGATEWAQVWAHAAAFAGERANASVLLGSGNPGVDGLIVMAQSPVAASVRVRPGGAMVKGRYYKSTATETLAIAANASGNGRIDTIILRVDYTAQTIRLAVKQGTPAASPVRPTLTQTAGVLWEAPLADITVANGFTVINEADIYNYPEYANAPSALVLDDFSNQASQELMTGEVVTFHGSVARAASVMSNINNPEKVAGVWVGLAAASGRGRILSKGTGYVYVNGGVSTLLSLISPHSVAGQGIVGSYAPFAMALETRVGSGLVFCYIDATQENLLPKLIAEVELNPLQTIVTGTTTTVTNWVDGAVKTVAGMHSNGTNPSRLFAPRRGLWDFFVFMTFSATTGTYREVEIYSSGGTVLAVHRMPLSGGGALSVSISAKVWIASDNDYVEVKVRHDAGVNISIGVASRARWNFVGNSS